MEPKSLADLSLDLKRRRLEGDPPPVLLMGAGASIGAGIGAMPELYAFAGCKDFAGFARYIDTFTAAERFRLLARFLQTQKPAEMTDGYRALASLCAEAFFDLVLTTNLDPLLDDALAGARLWRKDYLLLVNGVCRADRIDPLLRAPHPRVKVIKLHGDLFHRFMAWTPAEMESYVEELRPSLERALYGRDLLVIGHSLRDERIHALARHVLSADGVVWYADPGPPPADLAANKNVRALIGADFIFERLLPALAQELGLAKQAQMVRRKATPAPASAQPTIDDFMASVFTLLTPEGHPSCTAFLLRAPRVIVADGWSAPGLIQKDRVRLRAGDAEYPVRVLKNTASKTNPFGPVLLEAPGEVQVAGLGLNPSLMTPSQAVSLAVAAGEKTGVSRGSVRDPSERTIEIAPLGRANHVVEVQCAVRSGSCGAPLVDESFDVRGFVVAGNDSLTNPVAVIHPASRWAQFLREPPRTPP